MEIKFYFMMKINAFSVNIDTIQIFFKKKFEFNKIQSQLFKTDWNLIPCSQKCAKCSSLTTCQYCKEGFYLDQKGNCQQCRYNCKTCTKDECTSCLSDTITNRQDKVPCLCAKGYIDDGRNMICQKCPYNCETCDINLKCTSCNTIQTNRDNNPNCDCLTGYFDDGQNMNCIQCPYQCKTCTKGQGNKCGSCDTSKFRLEDKPELGCPCKDGYYDDSISPICQKCPYNCKKCVFENKEVKCLDCFNDEASYHRKKLDEKNQCLCEDGYYDDGTKECKECPYYCKNCKKKSDEIICLACPNETENHRSGDQCECQPGYYENKQNKQIKCEKCEYPCLTCEKQADFCTSCDNQSGRTLDYNKKKCLCIGNYQDNPDDPKDIKCDQIFGCKNFCQTCEANDSNSCLSCIENRVIVENALTKQKECQCKNGYFELDQNCKVCNKSCSECYGEASNNCIKCSDSLRVPINHGECTCKDGFVEVSDVCQPCHETCKKCSGGFTKKNCTDCNEKYNRILNNNNECVCKQGFVELQGDKVCINCNPLCQICDPKSKNKCLTCKQEDFRELNQLNGECECKQGYFQSGQQVQCKKCQNTCSICTDYNQCKECVDNRIQVNGVCLCSDGYYEDSVSQICKICDKNCKTCSDEKTCLSCNQNSRLNEHDICEQIFPTHLSKQELNSVFSSTQYTIYFAISAVIAGSLVLDFISLNSRISSLFLNLQKISFLLYINISYPEVLFTFLKALGQISPFIQSQKIDFFNQFITQDSSGVHLPNKFLSEDIGSSILFNCGGCLSVLLPLWILVGISFILYRKNTLIKSKLQNINLSAKLLKIFMENILSFSLVQINFIASIIISFSIAIQFTSFVLSFENSVYYMCRLVASIILLLYLILLIVKTFYIVNNTKNFLIEFKDYYNDNVEGFIYRILNDDYRQDNIYVRNYKLLYLLIENLLVPFSVSLFYFNFKAQTILLLIFQILICIISCWQRPYKSIVSNIFLIIEQVMWVIIILTILIIGFCIENIFTKQSTTNNQIKLMDGLSWFIVILCFIVLFINPLAAIIEILINYQIYNNKIKRFYFWIQVSICGYQTSTFEESLNSTSLRYLNDSFTRNYLSQKLNSNTYLRRQNIAQMSLFDISSQNVLPKKKQSSEKSRSTSRVNNQSHLNNVRQSNQKIELPTLKRDVQSSPPRRQNNNQQQEVLKINLIKQQSQF